MRGKQWPYWEAWQDIFGKDRANGSNAEDLLEAMNDLDAKEKSVDVSLGADYYVGMEDMFEDQTPEHPSPDDPAEDSVCQVGGSTRAPKQSGKKRKADDTIDGLLNLLCKMHHDTNARLNDLSKRIGYEYDMSNARKEVFDTVIEIPGLSIEDQFVACDLLVKEVNRMEMFLSLPKNSKPAYVMHLLKRGV